MKKKKLFRCVIAAILLLVTASAVYFFQFSQCGYLMTVPHRPVFTEIADNVYINKNYAGDQQEVLELISQAEERDRTFFGELSFWDETIIIICDDEKMISKLGEDHATPTYFVPSKKHYICISDEYLNLDILAHEITHAELHTRLSKGALKRIPTWFDEGLATQNDYREQYSEEQWIKQTDSGKNIIALEDMDAPAEFYAGEAGDRRFRYLNAKHELAGWIEKHGQQGLTELLDELNNGTDFAAAYGR